MFHKSTSGYWSLSVNIQPARIDNLETLYRIEKECFGKDAYPEDYLSYLLAVQNSIALVAEVDEEIVGFIIGLFYNYAKIAVGHIYTLNVSPGHRRKGVGSRLLNEMERILTDKDANTCYLETRLDDVVARNFYRKHGYTEAETLRNYYARGKHGIRLNKKLR